MADGSMRAYLVELAKHGAARRIMFAYLMR